MKKSNYFKLPVLLTLTASLIMAYTPFDVNNGEWEILFDGQNTDKWRAKQNTAFPAQGWKVEDGLLFLDGKGGDIITKEKYADFELVFEFNFTEGANSGIKYFVDTIVNEKTGNIMVNGPEYQIIDDYNHPEIKPDPNGLSSSGSTYLLYAPKGKKLNPHGEWNTGKIIAKGNKVEHWLNNTKVVSYKRGSKDFLKRKSETKFKDDAHYGELESGHILLTDHHDKVYFRNIKVRKL
jgi:uncharacterized protein YaaR (DUF327 family)